MHYPKIHKKQAIYNVILSKQYIHIMDVNTHCMRLSLRKDSAKLHERILPYEFSLYELFSWTISFQSYTTTLIICYVKNNY